ncbi:hypothetical protein B446_05320 [Streptomyces collinus Tu 365]|uniref:Uncharacterized protein n=1 Tax=Streptomyces collinus (strain DSM 40733 / Tue 365) TaxID=1214242 RepID=S5VHI3_STRC3|nr:hypothetical protein B446_05320 [Streptomyces collinus Tu 365]
MSPLGEPLLVGEALTPADAEAEGLAEGRGEGTAVRGGGPGRRVLVARGVGFAFAEGGALVGEGERGAGDVPRVAGGGRRVPSPSRSWTPLRAGCVLARSGDACASGRRTSGPSRDGCSGVDAARGAAAWGSTDAVARPPRSVKVAAARDLTAYLFSRAGRPFRSAGGSCGTAGGPGRDGPEEFGTPFEWSHGIGVSTVAAASFPSLDCAAPGSYAPHSGQVTAPLSVRLHGLQ